MWEQIVARMLRSPLGHVDMPSRVAAAPRNVRGWAHAEGEVIVGLVVLLDGEFAALAKYGVERPDVVAKLSLPGARFSGWQARLDLSGYAGRRLSVSALAITASGRTIEIPRRQCAVEIPRRVVIKAPVTDEIVSAGRVRVSGYVVMERSPARVEVLIDGVAIGRARLEPAQGASQLGSGATRFSMRVDLRQQHVGTVVRIHCQVTDLDGVVTRSDVVAFQIGARRNDAPMDPQRLATLRERVSAVAKAKQETQASTKIRLLVMTHQLGYGGAQLYLLELLRQLVRQPDVACVVVSPTDGPLRAELESLGIVVHVSASRGRSNGYPLGSADEYEGKMLELALLAKWYGCDIVLANTMVCGMAVDLAGRLGVPGLWVIHESFTLEEWMTGAGRLDGVDPYIRECLQTAMSDAAAVVFVADTTREICLAGAADPRRFVTIPYGIDLDTVQRHRDTTNRASLRAQYGIKSDDIVVLCVGTYEPRKAQFGLALAFAELAETHPTATLVMVGDTGSKYSHAVRDVVGKLDMGDRIKLVPVVADPYPWFSVADIFALPSDFESLPRAILEAMAFGLPVLTTDVFGMSELISDGENGHFCAPRDVASLVSALGMLLDDTPQERSAVAAAAERMVFSRYDSHGYAAAFLTLLRGLHAQPSALPRDLLDQSAPATPDSRSRVLKDSISLDDNGTAERSTWARNTTGPPFDRPVRNGHV